MIWADATCKPLTAQGKCAVNYDNRSIGKGITNPYTFTGRRYDPETGLYCYRNRYHDPKLGRFISRDPIGFEGSQWNLYEYVGNRPLGSVDPFGLETVAIFCGHSTTPGDPNDLSDQSGLEYIDGLEEEPGDQFGCISCTNDDRHDQYLKKFPDGKIVPDFPEHELLDKDDLEAAYKKAMDVIKANHDEACKNGGGTTTVKITCGTYCARELFKQMRNDSPCQPGNSTIELKCPECE